MYIWNTISIVTDYNKVDDIQIWSNTEGDSKLGVNALKSNDSFRVISYVKCELIPIYLLISKPLRIYSNNEKTAEFFKKELIQFSVNYDHIGLMIKNETDENLFLVLYVDSNSGDLQIRCLVIDFSILEKVHQAIESDNSPINTSSFINLESSIIIPKSSNTSIFDKVLSGKGRRLKSNLFIMPSTSIAKRPATQLSSSVLTTNDQITQAVSKVILSGLRIRGLNLNSTNQSTNEKIAIKEVYKMTYKSTMFSLRKFNYGFNQELLKSSKNGHVELNDIQDIVEKLLQVFVDIDDLVSSNSTPKPF